MTLQETKKQIYTWTVNDNHEKGEADRNEWCAVYDYIMVDGRANNRVSMK